MNTCKDTSKMAQGGHFRKSVSMKDYNCSDCLNGRNVIYTEAVFFCPECNKYLCRQCYVCEHDVIGRKNVDKWVQKAQFDPCKKHRSYMLDLYCQTHDSVCCAVCSKDKHKSCDDLIYIPMFANAKENNAGLEKVQKDLEELHMKADKVSKDTSTNLDRLDETEKGLVTGVREFRAKVDALMNDIEKQSLDDIAKFKALSKDKYKLELDMCNTIKTEMNDLKNKLKAKVKDESLLFSRIKQAHEKVREKHNIISGITCSKGCDVVMFEPNTEIENLLNGLQGLGKILKSPTIDRLPSSRPRSQNGNNSENLQCPDAQPVTPNKPYRTVNITESKVNTDQDKNTCDITGVCMMPSGHIILTDYGNSSLKKLSTASSHYDVTNSCSLSRQPLDACYIGAGQVAVALSGHKGMVQFVTVSGKMTCTSFFSTKHYSYSLTYSNKTKCLYVTCFDDTAVYVYDLEGIQKRVITHDQRSQQLFSCTRRITTSRDGARLHITTRKGMVTTDIRGDLIARFASDVLKEGAYAVCSDLGQNVFVGGYNSNAVLQVGEWAANKTIAELLSNTEEMHVQALCFDHVNSMLLVFSHFSNTCHLLHLLK